MPGYTSLERDINGFTYVDKSGSITAGGAAQTLMAANPDRDHARIGNPNATATLWINDLGGTAAVNGAGSTEIVPGQTIVTWARNAISIISGVTGAKFSAGEA